MAPPSEEVGPGSRDEPKPGHLWPGELARIRGEVGSDG